MSEIERVQIFNSELQREFNLYVRKSRLLAFSALINEDRSLLTRPPNPMPGLSWGGMLGLDAIFAQRPKKFPTNDILDWLRRNVLITPAVTNNELEQALERFAAIYPPDASEDA